MVSWGGVDTVATADRAVAEYKNRVVSRVNVDATGVGAGVAPHMQKAGCSANPVKVASKSTQTTEMGEFYILRDQLWCGHAVNGCEPILGQCCLQMKCF